MALDDVARALEALPASAGVGQLLAADGRNLVIGRPAHLRRWAASHLGAGPPPPPGRRPPVDLRPVAASLRYARAGSEFQQRLLFERLMARHVPLSARRDLRAVAWLHLDAAERFPRLSVRTGRAARAPEGLFGPFASAKAAGRARDALHKRFPLRPCDYRFEPHPELPLGLGCVFAQTRTCAAPCLSRIDEAGYRELAAEVEGFLARPGGRAAVAGEWLPDWVAARAGARAMVAAPVKGGWELYPVLHGRVLEERAVRCGEEALDAAARATSWDEPAAAGLEPDWPWLAAWLHGPRRKGRYVVIT